MSSKKRRPRKSGTPTPPRRRHEPATPEEAAGALWVQSEYLPDGTFAVGFHVGEDTAWALTRDQATAHAVAVIALATEAEHDAAVLASMTGAGLETTLVAEVIALARDERPDHDAATAPLQFHPGVAARDRSPFLRVELAGHPPWQWTPAAARRHAHGVLQVIAAVDLDNALSKVLVQNVGIEQGNADAVISSLVEHWPAEA